MTRREPAVQVTDAPKISQDSIPQRSVDSDQRDPQMVEQMVEMPTIVSIVAVLKNKFDVSVGRWFGSGGLQGLLPAQSLSPSVEQTVQFRVVVGVQAVAVFKVFSQNSTASSPEQIFGITVRSGGPQGFHPGQSSAALAEQIVDFHVPGGSPHPDPGLAASSAVSRDEAFQQFFRTFPQSQKSAESAAGPSPRVPGSSSSWTPAAYEAPDPPVTFVRNRVRRTRSRQPSGWLMARGLDFAVSNGASTWGRAGPGTTCTRRERPFGFTASPGRDINTGQG